MCERLLIAHQPGGAPSIFFYLVDGLNPAILLCPSGSVHSEALGPGIDDPSMVNLPVLPLPQHPDTDLLQGDDVLGPVLDVLDQDAAVHLPALTSYLVLLS